MKYKAKDTYKELSNEDNFISLGSASNHLLLIADMEVEFKNKIPSKLIKHLVEIKKGNK